MTREQKGQIQLIIIALAIVGIVFIIFRLRGKAPAPPPSAEVPALAPAALDTALLTKEKFKTLRGYGPYPLRPGTTGRVNPFLPPIPEGVGESGGASLAPGAEGERQY